MSVVLLATPNSAADDMLAAHARKLLDLMPAMREHGSFTDRIRSIVLLLIQDGHASAERVAECLGVSLRTLQRQLVCEGQTFGKLLNQTRLDLALRYLGSWSHSVAVVAQLTGYSTSSAFTRWFTSATGKSPVQWRKLDSEIGRRRIRLRQQSRTAPGPGEPM
jgi:AraC-like DNA-binding protein